MIKNKFILCRKDESFMIHPVYPYITFVKKGRSTNNSFRDMNECTN